MGGRLWKIGGRVVDVSHRGVIMGVLNVTPDSFSDGGKFFDPEGAVAHGAQMAAEGADVIDVGGESTRPGAEPVSAEEELRRVIPVIEKLRANIGPHWRFASVSPSGGEEQENLSASGTTQKFISIDTSKAEVASAALAAGATIVNDVTGGRGDEKMMPLIAQKGTAFIIMHMQGEPPTMQRAPQYVDVVAEVTDFFRQQYARALECGIDPMAIAFDPGIGFGKTQDHNLELLANLEQLRVENRPLVVGVSRKSFLGKIIGSANAQDRLMPTVALTSLLHARGGDVFRVHDVKENMAALRVSEAILER